MPTTLIVWLLDSPRFVVVDTLSRAVLAAGSDPAQLPPKPEQTLVLVPGELCYSTTITLAAKQRAKQIKALGFLLEDELASDLDGLHWVSQPRDETALDVLVVERAQMDQWLDRLAQWGIRPDLLCPDYLAVPEVDVLASAGSKWLLRTGACAGAAGEPDLIAALWRERADAEPPGEIESLSASQIARLGVDRKLPNLLAQHYAFSSDRPSPWRAYRWAALAAGLAATLAFAWLAFGTWRLDRADTQLDQQMVLVFKQALPAATRVVDARAQLAQAFKQRSATGAATDALGLINALGRAKQASPGLKVKTMSYRDGGLQVDIHARTLADLDRLMASLGADTRVRAEVKSAASGADGVSARLNVIAGAGT